MKKLLSLLTILILVAGSAWAGPPITQGINTGAIGEIGATTPNRGTFTDTYWYGANVAHGMTSIAPTNDYGAAFYMSSTIGGLDLYGLTDADQVGALRLTGITGAADPTDAYAALVLRGGKKNGTGWQALGAAESVAEFYNYTTSLGKVYGNGEWILTSLQNTPVGSTIASTGAFTTLSASTSISTPLIKAAYVTAGSEKMTGGTTWTGATGATPPTGWSVVNAGLFDIADSGDGVPYDIALRISVDATPTASPAITIPISTILGHGYQVSYAFKKGTGASGTVKVGSTSGGSEYYTSGTITDAAWATRHVNLIAAGTTIYVTLMNNSGTAGETAWFDTVQFTESPLTIDGPLNIGGLLHYGNTQFLNDEGTITLPRVTENWSGHGWVRVSGAGVIADSAEFELGYDGNVSLIRGTANVVVGAACADTKICISTAAAQNPVIIKARNGTAYVSVEFWYH